MAVLLWAPECGSWHDAQAWWPGGALDFSTAWQVPHAGAGVSLCTSSPWQVAHARWPAFVVASLISDAWHALQVVVIAAGMKSCGWWHD